MVHQRYKIVIKFTLCVTSIVLYKNEYGAILDLLGNYMLRKALKDQFRDLIEERCTTLSTLLLLSNILFICELQRLFHTSITLFSRPWVEYKGVIPQNEIQNKQKDLELEANALISVGGKVSDNVHKLFLHVAYGSENLHFAI